jgi:hypothetical protein
MRARAVRGREPDGLCGLFARGESARGVGVGRADGDAPRSQKLLSLRAANPAQHTHTPRHANNHR